MPSKTLTKQDFIQLVANEGEYETKAASEKAINAFMAAVKTSLANGDKISLIGFGKFEGLFCVSSWHGSQAA